MYIVKIDYLLYIIIFFQIITFLKKLNCIDFNKLIIVIFFI